MFDGHKGWLRDSLLRASGIVLLAICWLLMRRLFHAAALRPEHDPSLPDAAAAAIGFLCFSAGAALTTLGEHIFDQVETSQRWARHRDVRRTKECTASRE